MKIDGKVQIAQDYWVDPVDIVMVAPYIAAGYSYDNRAFARLYLHGRPDVVIVQATVSQVMEVLRIHSND